MKDEPKSLWNRGIKLYSILRLQVCVVKENLRRFAQYWDDQCCKFLCLYIHVHVSQTLIEICFAARPVLHNHIIIIYLCATILGTLWMCLQCDCVALNIKIETKEVMYA